MSKVDINVNGQMDGRTDGRTNGQKIRRLYHTLLEAGAKKMKLAVKKALFNIS